MTWIVTGLLCGQLACMWYAPVTSRAFTDEASCLQSITTDDEDELIRFRDDQSIYRTLKCRRTTQRRME